MAKITINGRSVEFQPGQTILQAANAGQVAIPQYCYHDGLSIAASCRICLVEVWAPNPKTGQLEPFMGGKLLPSCQQTASDGMVVYSDSPKAMANQKAVMEFLLINHPLDCPVCDQSGECFLQDYSYEYGRGVSRFQEQKVKNPKKDVGPNVLLYSDRCIMCTRCVRFTREVTGTSELTVTGRGNKEEIDVFPGVPLDNPLASNVIDLCPVGALLDKDFLFAQRVWFLKETAGVDPLTASGDNITLHHNEGKVYRVKPRFNPAINQWWITDEVRYGWKFVHAESRLRTPTRRQFGTMVECDYHAAYQALVNAGAKSVEEGKRLALLVSPMLTCEEAWQLARVAKAIDPKAILGIGPVPFHGEDQTFPRGAKPGDPKAFTTCAEKAPNARGVRRSLAAVGGQAPLEFDAFVGALGQAGCVILTGNYPSAWSTPALRQAIKGRFVGVIETLANDLTDLADVVIPGATFAEKAGTFENRTGVLQAFGQAIPVIELAKSEGQIATDLLGLIANTPERDDASRVIMVESTRGQVASGARVAMPRGEAFDAAKIRAAMGAMPGLDMFKDKVVLPAGERTSASDMTVVTL